MVDGYSLLNSWTDLAPGFSPFSMQARTELIHRLARYADTTQTPITIVFDGTRAPEGLPKEVIPKGIEVIYSSPGQTADQVIERVAALMQPYGPILAVTNDNAERETVVALGGVYCSCESFIGSVDGSSEELERHRLRHNLSESAGFKRSMNRNIKGL